MIELPEECLRGLSSCTPYAQQASTCGASFFCCGKNDGSDRSVDQDEYTVCFKNAEIDERTHADERDLITWAAILTQACHVISNVKLTME